MDEGNYQLLYFTILDFFVSQEQTLMFHHFLEQLYHTFAESYIDQEHILIDKVIFQLHASHFFNFKIIMNKFQHFWILPF